MKMGKLLYGAMALATLVFLGGCTEQVSPYPADDPMSDFSKLADSSGAISYDPDDREEADEQDTESGLVIPDAIDEVSAFSDGVAWIRYYDGTQALVDETGAVLFDDDGADFDYTKFVQGCSLVRGDTKQEGYGPFGLVNKQGEIIWTVDDDARALAEDLYGAENIERVYCPGQPWEAWDGYLLVSVEVDRYEFTGTVFGIVGPDGNWAVEFPSVDDAANGSGLYGYEAGLLYDLYNPGVMVLHKTGLFITRTGEYLPCTDSDLHPGGRYYMYGEDRLEEDDVVHNEAAIAHGGLRLSMGVFYDENGEAALDLTDMNNLSSNPDYGFEDGEHCLVSFANDGGGAYQTIIDKEGNFLFDPIKADPDAVFATVGFFYQPDKESAGWYVGLDGEQIGVIEGTEGTPFCDNRAWIKVDGIWRLINETGDVVI